MTPWGAMTIRASCEAWHARGLVGGWPQKGHEGQGRIEEEQGRGTRSRAPLLARDKLQSRETWGLLTAPSSLSPFCALLQGHSRPTHSSFTSCGHSGPQGFWLAPRAPVLCSSHEGRKVFAKANSHRTGIPWLTHMALVFPGASLVLSLGMSCALQVSRVTARLITPLSHRGFYFWFGFLLC